MESRKELEEFAEVIARDDLRDERTMRKTMNDDQIKHMVERFLMWKLPENFNPDGGISFKKMRNEQSPWPAKNEPVGTNLLDYTQATEMVRYMIEGLPPNSKDTGKES